MAIRVYYESVKKYAVKYGIATASILAPAFLIFLYLASTGAITITGNSGDTFCAGTIEEPCYAYVNFTANEDIFIYPLDYDPYGRDTPIMFDPGVKSWRLQRSWGSSWRTINLSKTWSSKVKYAWKMNKDQDYQVRLEVILNEPNQLNVKWGFGPLDPVFNPIETGPNNTLVILGVTYNRTDIVNEKEVGGDHVTFMYHNPTDIDLDLAKIEKKIRGPPARYKKISGGEPEYIINTVTYYNKTIPVYNYGTRCIDWVCTKFEEFSHNTSEIAKNLTPGFPDVIHRGETVYIDYAVRFTPSLEIQKVDIIPNIAGFEFPEFTIVSLDYGYTKNICLQNPSAVDWTENFTAYITIDTTDTDRFQADNDDLTITDNVTGSDLEIDRYVLFNNTENTLVFFKTNRTISAGATDCDYNLWYGDSDKSVIMDNATNIFLWYEDFEEYADDEALCGATEGIGDNYFCVRQLVSTVTPFNATTDSGKVYRGSTAGEIIINGNWLRFHKNITGLNINNGNYSFGMVQKTAVTPVYAYANVRARAGQTNTFEGFSSGWGANTLSFLQDSTVRRTDTPHSPDPILSEWYFVQSAAFEHNYSVGVWNASSNGEHLFNGNYSHNTYVRTTSDSLSFGAINVRPSYYDDLWIREFTGAFNPDDDVNYTLGDEESIVDVTIATPTGNNLTSEDITATFSLRADYADSAVNITDWRIEGNSLMLLNAPFENQSNADTNAMDYSSYGNTDASIAGRLLCGDSHGGNSNCYYNISSATDYVDFPAGGSYSVLGTGNISLGLWFKPIITENAWVVFNGVSGAADAIAIGCNNGALSFMIDDGTTQTNSPTYSAIAINEWHYVHVNYNRDGGLGVMWIDGVNQTPVDISNSYRDLTMTGTPFKIGGDGAAVYNGYYDDVYLYNRTLSEEQILFINSSRNDIISSEETSRGENWTAVATLNNKETDIQTKTSNTITILTGDSCTYSSGNWIVACADNCNIITNTIIDSGANISMTGHGNVSIDNANVTGWLNTLVQGTDAANRCVVNILNGAIFG